MKKTVYMTKIPQIAYTIFFALCFVVTGYFLFDLSKSHKALKASHKVLELAVESEINKINSQVDSLKTTYKELESSDAGIISDIEDLRKTKADISKKKNDEKNTAASYSAESIKRKWAERYPG